MIYLYTDNFMPKNWTKHFFISIFSPKKQGIDFEVLLPFFALPDLLVVQKISCENTSATDFQLLAPEIIQQKKSDGPSFLDLHLGYEILHISTKYICYTLIF